MTLLNEKVTAAPILLISMRNGDNLTCRCKNQDGNVMLAEELDMYGQPIGLNCEMLIMLTEISHIRFPVVLEQGAYEHQSSTLAEGAGSGEFAEAIQQAKSRHRGNEFSMTSPQGDGVETQKFRPRIEE